MHVHHVPHSSRARGTVLSLKTSFVVHRKHERNSSQRSALYIFQNVEISMLVTFH